VKQNIEYYQHYTDADKHPKFKMLRIKYGWAGDGKFWALNNRIADADGCKIDTTKKYNMATIANDLEFSMDELQQFIEYLHSECELIIKENGYITTEIVQENLNKVSKKREKNQEDYKKRITESLRNCQRTESEIQTSENIQSKVKEIKLNKRKESLSSDEPPKFDFLEQNFSAFWSAYPKKVDKKNALKAFKKINPNPDKFLKLMESLRKQIKAWETKDKQYIPNPATWLNGERWEDEVNALMFQPNGVYVTNDVVTETERRFYFESPHNLCEDDRIRIERELRDEGLI
jgi:hypothetical protein